VLVIAGWRVFTHYEGLSVVVGLDKVALMVRVGKWIGFGMADQHFEPA